MDLRPCFDCSWDLSSFACAIILLLSHNKVIEVNIDVMYPRYTMSFFNYTASLAASLMMMYSTSIIKYLIVVYLKLFQVNKNPDVDLLELI